MTQDEANQILAGVQNLVSSNHTLYDKVIVLEAENQVLRVQLGDMKLLCINTFKEAIIRAAETLPSVPPPRLPTATSFSVSGSTLGEARNGPALVA